MRSARPELPLALADLHRSRPVGAVLDIEVMADEHELVVGAGFEIDGVNATGVRAVRARTLPDYVAPNMRLLLVGLNPSLYAADAGVPFARPGNRFWPAAMAAGVVSRDRDARHALTQDLVGFTDLVKRATRSAAELTDAEYRAGVSRVERLVAWLQPGGVCFLGLTGWRRAVDAVATEGFQATSLGGRPTYVMPNPSGVNAHVRVTDVARHLAAAAGGV